MSDTQTPPLSDTKPRKAKNRRVAVLVSALIIVAAAVFGGLGGYAQAMNTRMIAQQTSEGRTIAEQFKLAEKDFAEKRYDLARQRLDYILKNDQSYPGAVDLLTKLMVQMAVTPSLTPTLVPTVTPTPDTRAQEAIFAQSESLLKAKDWTNLLATLDALRKRHPNYRAAKVDGMYYAGLRNRGMNQILGLGDYATTNEHPERRNNLEGGIYDLTLAERFGPLDGTADGLRNAARMYIIGASFWELDWEKAIFYFEQAAALAPSLHDASNMTAGTRYYQALLNYGDELSETGTRLKDRCLALNPWAKARDMSSLNEEYTNKFNTLFLECNPPTETPPPPAIEEPTATTEAPPPQ